MEESMRALITGITGFAGSHLAEYILAEQPGVEVFGTFRWRSRMGNVEHLDKQIKLIEADLRDYSSMHRALEISRPDFIFHLAAQSFVPASWTAPNDTIVTNVTGQTNLFEAIRILKLDPVVQIACSSEQYGLVLPDEVPIRETNPLRPLSPYAVSKVAQDYLGYQYFQSYGLKVIRTRGFNHTGPRRGQVFVTSNFCSQVAAIELGLQEPVIRVGNIEAIRDFTDVRDMVRAYWLAVTKARPGEVYNIATGQGIRIREMLDRVLALSKVDVKVEVDPARLRPSDVEILIGDSSKFRADTGWEPRIPFEQTVHDLLDYWRKTLAARKQAPA
jgi:GDP-4-dehydro-6-deoxy-D-mannose reductase